MVYIFVVFDFCCFVYSASLHSCLHPKLFSSLHRVNEIFLFISKISMNVQLKTAVVKTPSVGISQARMNANATLAS